MSTELDHRDNLLVHPLTAEAIDLAQAPDEKLAEFLSDLRNHEFALREAKHIITREALRRMDYAGRWTYRAGPYTLKSQSPQPGEEFDELALREDLLKLVDSGELAPHLVDDAVEPVVTYKVRRAGINTLRKLGGRIKAIVDEHARESEKTRYVSIARGVH